MSILVCVLKAGLRSGGLHRYAERLRGLKLRILDSTFEIVGELDDCGLLGDRTNAIIPIDLERHERLMIVQDHFRGLPLSGWHLGITDLGLEVADLTLNSGE